MKHLRKLVLAASTATALMVTMAAGTAFATSMEVGGVAKNSSVEIEATVKSGTSAILKDEFGTTTDTCTTSEVKGKTEGSFEGATVGGKVSTLTFKNCTHTTTVIANGSISFAWTSGTNASVSSSGAEVTVQSTFFGASAVCKTGTGTKIGTLTGVSAGNATIDVEGTINCGILGNSKWTGTYSVTKPSGLGVVLEGGGEGESHPLRTTPGSLLFPTGSQDSQSLTLETKGPHFSTNGVPSFVKDMIDTPWSGMDVDTASLGCWSHTFGSSCTVTITSTASATGNGFIKIPTTSGPRYVRIYHS